MWLPPPHTGQRRSLTEPDWSATAQPAGQNLVIHTLPQCLFLTALFASSLCYLSSFPFYQTPRSIFLFFSPSLHLRIFYLPLIRCLTNPSILFSPNSWWLHPVQTVPQQIFWKDDSLFVGKKLFLEGLRCPNAWRLAQPKPQRCCLSWDVNKTSCCDLVGYKWSEAISIQLDGCSQSKTQGSSLLLQKQHRLLLLDVIFWHASHHVAAHWTWILVVWRKNPMCDPSARDAAKPDDSCSGTTWRNLCMTAAQASWRGFALLHLCMIEGYGSCYVNLLHSALFKSWRVIRDTDLAAKSDGFQSPQDGFSLNWCRFKGFFSWNVI